MLKLTSTSLPNPVFLHTVYTLSDDISAMQILPVGDTGVRLSPVSRLPRGAQIEACGPGFNGQTLKVSYQGQFYFVFLQDLEPQKKAAATAMAATG